MADVCLIVCFYNGNRSGNQQNNFIDYINMHKYSLSNLSHNLSRIVFVISKDELVKDEPAKIDVKVNDTLTITHYYRKNRNLSFGGWDDAMKTFMHQYYILCEDDYIFTCHNFDKILLENYILKQSQYLVTWYARREKRINYIYNGCLISTIGIMSRKYLNAFIHYNNDYYSKEKAMLRFLGGFKTISTLDGYTFPYWAFDTNNIVFYGSKIFYKLHYNKKLDKNDYNIYREKIIVACYQFCKKYDYLNFYFSGNESFEPDPVPDIPDKSDTIRDNTNNLVNIRPQQHARFRLVFN